MPLRLVIADDESLIRMDLREMLTSLGYEVVGEATDGREAVRLARKTHPDLVLMDIKMPPGLDGVSAARQLTAEALAPTVFLTAYADGELVDARDAGAVGFLVKPMQESRLRPAIEIAVARAGELRARAQQVAKLSEDLETRKLLDRAKGVLMAQTSCSEAEAYQKIQRLAMNSRTSIRQVCDALLLTSDV